MYSENFYSWTLNESDPSSEEEVTNPTSNTQIVTIDTGGLPCEITLVLSDYMSSLMSTYSMDWLTML